MLACVMAVNQAKCRFFFRIQIRKRSFLTIFITMQIEVLIALLLFGSASLTLLEQQWELHQHLQQTLQFGYEATLKRNQNERTITAFFSQREVHDH